MKFSQKPVKRSLDLVCIGHVGRTLCLSGQEKEQRRKLNGNRKMFFRVQTVIRSHTSSFCFLFWSYGVHQQGQQLVNTTRVDLLSIGVELTTTAFVVLFIFIFPFSKEFLLCLYWGITLLFSHLLITLSFKLTAFRVGFYT